MEVLHCRLSGLLTRAPAAFVWNSEMLLRVVPGPTDVTKDAVMVMGSAV